jgi:hypothetical protein
MQRADSVFHQIITLGPEITPPASYGLEWFYPQQTGALDYEVFGSICKDMPLCNRLHRILDLIGTEDKRTSLFGQRSISAEELQAQEQCVQFLKSLAAFCEACALLHVHVEQCTQFAFAPVLDAVQLSARNSFVKWLESVYDAVIRAERQAAIRPRVTAPDATAIAC